MMSTDPTAPGAPLLLTRPPVTEALATTDGFEQGDGFQMILAADALLITVRMEGHEAEIGISIEELLEAVGRYNRKTGS